MIQSDFNLLVKLLNFSNTKCFKHKVKHFWSDQCFIKLAYKPLSVYTYKLMSFYTNGEICSYRMVSCCLCLCRQEPMDNLVSRNNLSMSVWILYKVHTLEGRLGLILGVVTWTVKEWGTRNKHLHDIWTIAWLLVNGSQWNCTTRGGTIKRKPGIYVQGCDLNSIGIKGLKGPKYKHFNDKTVL